MDNKDIRWVQRFSNYQKALKQLKEAVNLMETREGFQLGLIEDGEIWMNMIKSRNLTDHICRVGEIIYNRYQASN